MNNTTLIQWKCRGIRVNYEEFLLLLNKYNPKVVCPQETFLKDINQLNIRNYNAYNHLRKVGHRASGGVSILVWKYIPQHQINIDSELQVITVRKRLHQLVNICCHRPKEMTGFFLELTPPAERITLFSWSHGTEKTSFL